MEKGIKKRMIRRAIKKRAYIIEKIQEELCCNKETAKKSIEFKNENQRKKMAANFYRGSR